MPKYDYRCPECKNIVEHEHPIAGQQPQFICESCPSGVTMRKMFSATPSVFKGHGWGKTYGVHKPKGNGLD